MRTHTQGQHGDLMGLFCLLRKISRIIRAERLALRGDPCRLGHIMSSPFSRCDMTSSSTSMAKRMTCVCSRRGRNDGATAAHWN
jgi:hypothetical protein